MTGRAAPAIALLMLALGQVGCGGGPSPAATTSRTSSTASLAGGTPAARPANAPARRGHPGKPAPAGAASHTTPGVATAPPPTPPGTPSPPDGLRAATGYASYDLCASACSGAVPSSLRRSLHLPRAAGGGCPASGAGPVSPVGASPLAITSFIGSSWSGARVQWSAAAAYTGPVLIRGRALDGAGAVGFGEGHVPVDELQLLHSGLDAPAAPAGGRSWLTFTRVRGPGCYAYQVDGTSFSTVIVFRAA